MNVVISSNAALVLLPKNYTGLGIQGFS